MRLGRRAALLVVLLSGCRSGTDHERLGDRRYAERAWVDAAAEYRLALRQGPQTPERLTKLAMATMQSGQLGEAARAWLQLGRTDEAGSADAVEGLLRTARLALDARDPAALRAAVEGLRALAMHRLAEVGPAVASLSDGDRRSGVPPELLLAAASGQPSRAALDSLLIAWADGLARSNRCTQAVPAYETVTRRSAGGPLTRHARGALAGCRVEEGRAALAMGNLDAASDALQSAIALGAPDSVVRLAWLLLGDTHWAAGDSSAAVQAYGKVLEGPSPDSGLARRAEEQLRRLRGTTDTPQG